MKKVKLYLCTQEAQRLFHITIKIDKAMRKLAVYASRGIFPTERYKFLCHSTEDAIASYRQFLDRIFEYLAPTDTQRTDLPYQQKIFQYKGILSSVRQTGNKVTIQLSTSYADEVLKLTKNTDVCIRICEEFALQNLEKVIALRKEVNDRIRLLDLAAEACSQDLYTFLKAGKNPFKRNRR